VHDCYIAAREDRGGGEDATLRWVVCTEIWEFGLAVPSGGGVQRRRAEEIVRTTRAGGQCHADLGGIQCRLERVLVYGLGRACRWVGKSSSATFGAQ